MAGSVAVGVIGGLLLSSAMEKPTAPSMPALPALDQEKDKEKQASAASDKMRRNATASTGRSSTLLTGPGGITTPATGERKTLLGS